MQSFTCQSEPTSVREALWQRRPRLSSQQQSECQGACQDHQHCIRWTPLYTIIGPMYHLGPWSSVNVCHPNILFCTSPLYSDIWWNTIQLLLSISLKTSTPTQVCFQGRCFRYLTVKLMFYIYPINGFQSYSKQFSFFALPKHKI